MKNRQPFAMTVPEKTKQLLRALSKTYETADFSRDDPSAVLRKYKSVRDTEVAAFIMALLSFGRREQFMQKFDAIFALAGTHPAAWLKSGAWQSDFPRGSKKFYRFFSYDDMRDVFAKLQSILRDAPTFGAYLRREWMSACAASGSENVELGAIIARAFPGCRAVPQKNAGAGKRIHMFLRWMVRVDSPVDVGFWTWYSSAKLTIPLDTHVLREAKALGLISEKSTAGAKTARELTNVLAQIFPGDPCRADFALFGLGVNRASDIDVQ